MLEIQQALACAYLRKSSGDGNPHDITVYDAGYCREHRVIDGAEYRASMRQS